MPPLLLPDLHAQHCLDQSWNFQALVCPVSISLFVFLFLSTMDFPSGGGVRSVHSLRVEPVQITPRCTRHLELSILWISFLDWRPSLQIHLIPDQMTLAEPARYISLPSHPLSFREKHWNCPCTAVVKGTLARSRTPAILINTNILPSVKLSGNVCDYCCHHHRPQVGTPKTLKTLGLDCKNWWVVS